jgi:metal-dependent amidase/aminoacylase/carboxypeptidase family protein
MKQLAESLAESMGGTCEFNIHVGYPCVVNHEELTEKNIQRASYLLGAENVVPLDLRMTAEDFAYYSQIMPSTFYRLGTAFPNREGEFKLHTPNFKVNEKAIETGIATMAWLTLCELLDLNF